MLSADEIEVVPTTSIEVSPTSKMWLAHAANAKTDSDLLLEKHVVDMLKRAYFLYKAWEQPSRVMDPRLWDGPINESQRDLLRD